METQVYTLRWWIGLLYVSQVLFIRILRNSFGVINNVYQGYFNISYYAIDWFTISQEPGIFIATIILVVLSISNMMGLRKLFIVMTTSTMVAYSWIILAFTNSKFFAFIYVGQFFGGFALQASVAIFSTFTTSWFPEDQIGRAMSIKMMSLCLGCMLGYLIPSQLVKPPPDTLLGHDNGSGWTATNRSNIDADHNDWIYEVRSRFLGFYGSCVGCCVIVLIFAFIFVADEPPKPPTVAQALLRAQRKQSEEKKTLASLSKCWNESKSILLNKTLIYGTILLAIMCSETYMENVLMGQISRPVFLYRQYGSTINSLSGYNLILNQVGEFFGNMIGGKLLDSLKRHKLILNASLTFSLISMIGLALGRHFLNVAVIFVFNATLGVSLGVGFSPLFDMVLQDTYPQNAGVVMLLYVIVGAAGRLLVGQFSRLILDFAGGTAVLVFLSALFLGAIIVAGFLLNPEYKRQKASKLEQNNTKEDLPLLNDSAK